MADPGAGKSHKSSNSWMTYQVCESCNKWSYEHGAQKNGFVCRNCRVALKTSGTNLVVKRKKEKQRKKRKKKKSEKRR